jgi:hypothetical protein
VSGGLQDTIHGLIGKPRESFALSSGFAAGGAQGCDGVSSNPGRDTVARAVPVRLTRRSSFPRARRHARQGAVLREQCAPGGLGGCGT